MSTTVHEYEILRELRQLKEMVTDLQAHLAKTNKTKPAEKFDESKYMTLKQLMAQQCFWQNVLMASIFLKQNLKTVRSKHRWAALKMMS